MTPKETYLQMVKALRETKDYDEYRATFKKYWSKDMAEFNGADAPLDQEGKERLFRFDQMALPTVESVQNAEEKIEGDYAVVIPKDIHEVLVPEGERLAFHFVKEGGEWKYDLPSMFNVYGSSSASGK